MSVPYFAFTFILQFFITLILSLVLTPIVKALACKIGAVDMPNARRINKKPMPSAGGLRFYSLFPSRFCLAFKKSNFSRSLGPLF